MTVWFTPNRLSGIVGSIAAFLLLVQGEFLPLQAQEAQALRAETLEPVQDPVAVRRTSSGEVVFGEIGCRPGGARLVDQMNFTCDIDLFREWARAVCWRSFEGRTERRYNVAILFKRALGQGRITRIDGLERFKQRFRGWVLEDELLRPGTHRRDWKQTLVSDGYVMVRHPDWDEAKRVCFAAATDITMYAE
jgi:hypothetical protein